MFKNSKFSGLRAAAAASFLGMLGLTSTLDDQEFEPPPNVPTKVFMTAETRETYGKFTNIVANFAPNLSVLIVTANDLGFKKGPSSPPSALPSRAPCDTSPAPATAETEESKQTMTAAREEILKLFDEFSPDNGNAAIIPRNNLRLTLNNHASLLNAHLSSASLKALGSAPATLYLTNKFPTIDNKLAIITMPAQPKTPEQNAALFSGLPASYISNMQSTAEDWAIFTLGHEIAGHASHGHDTPNPADFCKTPNYEWSSTRIVNETTSDIWGMRVFKAAQNAGVASNAPLETELEAMRALWTLYYNHNLETVQNSSQLGLHATTLGYDPQQPAFVGKMLYNQNAETARIPLLINLAADIVTGFVHSRQVKQDMAANPGNYTQKQLDEYRNVPISPQHIKNNLTAFASLGQRVRMQYPRNPQWHYESVSFLMESNVFSELMSDMPANEAAALEDILNDFSRAAEAYAPKLKNLEIAENIRKALPLEHINFLTHPRTYGAKPTVKQATIPDPDHHPAPPSS